MLWKYNQVEMDAANIIIDVHLQRTNGKIILTGGNPRQDVSL